MDDPTADAAYKFNTDPAWIEFIQTLEPMIARIVTKYCTSDEALQEDCRQEARIALACLSKEQCHAYPAYMSGEITEEQFDRALHRYLHNVIRNAALSMLDSYPKGNWYTGRTRHVKDRRTGKTRKVYLPARFSSLDMLVEEHGMQVDEQYNISWPDPSDDGLQRADTHGAVMTKRTRILAPGWAPPRNRGDNEA